MKIKSIIVTFILFAVLGSIPLFTAKDVKKITSRPAAIIVQVEEVKEMRSISKPAEINLLYRQF